MMMAARSGAMVAVLVLVNGLLVAAMSYEWITLGFEGIPTAAGDAPKVEVAQPSAVPVAKRRMEDYAAVLERPLFNEDRMPLTGDGDGEDEETKDFALLGVVLTPEQQVAILYSKRQEQPVKVARWDWFEGWRLLEVKPQSVVLGKGSRSIEMSLQRNSQSDAETK
jgi:hypothetical protein